MKKTRILEEIIEDTRPAVSAPCIGRLAGVSKRHEILVKFEDHSPQPAKLVAGIDRKELMRPENRSREVLLIFEKGDPKRPIIVGLMEDPLESLVSFELPAEKAQEKKDVLVDGKRITIEAEDEVMLKCGKASIHIRKDGRIIVKGTDVLSRSSGRQRIRGASVSIN